MNAFADFNHSAVSTPAAEGAGALPPRAPAPIPPSSWPQSFIARREAARRHLSAIGAVPYLLNRDGKVPLNAWSVPGWNGPFGDHDLIALAERLGMELC